jgi:hypothetical protein
MGRELKLFLSLILRKKSEKVFELHLRDAAAKPEFKSRTYAELAMKPEENYDGKKFRGKEFIKVDKIKVPSVHTDHDALFKYEGPGWESEIIGYRFYLDWRNANDIFGKKKKGLFLADVGATDTVAKDDSYHNMQEWGMDIFKVGNTLGIGSIGMMVDDSIYRVSLTDSVYFEMISNGPVLSEFSTKYFGWNAAGIKYNLTSNISIAAGSRLTQCNLELEGNAPNITTGLAKYEGTEFIKTGTDGEWSYIGLYGKQSLSSPEDQLGIAVFFRTGNLMMQSENDLNYYVKLNPDNNRLQYYFCAAWNQEEKGIKSKEEFVDYLEMTTRILNNPPVVQILN